MYFILEVFTHIEPVTIAALSVMHSKKNTIGFFFDLLPVSDEILHCKSLPVTVYILNSASLQRTRSW